MPTGGACKDLNHGFMLKQMVGTKLDVTKLLAPANPAAMPLLPPPADYGDLAAPDG